MNPGRAATRPSSSAPRTCPPAASGTTISGPVPAPSTAAAAWQPSPVTRLGLPVRIACPASESASASTWFIIPAASSPVTPATMTWSAPWGTASVAKSASAAAAASRVISACGCTAAPDNSKGASSAEASSQRRRRSDSANCRALAIAAPAAAASAIASCSSSAVNSPPRDRSVRYRWPKTSSPMRTGTPRNPVIGGCPGGNPADAG